MITCSYQAFCMRAALSPVAVTTREAGIQPSEYRATSHYRLINGLCAIKIGAYSWLMKFSALWFDPQYRHRIVD